MKNGHYINLNIVKEEANYKNMNNNKRNQEIEECVVYVRLELYNNAFPYGPKAIRKKLRDFYHVEPLPSESTISRILSRRCLTHQRTGYCEEDYE